MTEPSDIRIERPEAGLARVVFCRPDQGNSSRPKGLGELRDAFVELEADDSVRTIILAAEGKHFSVGADFGFLSDLTTMTATQIRRNVYDNFQGAARAIYRSSKPTVALVQGSAITVGCELTLACDFRIAADSAVFQESWIKLGIMPPLGGLFLLPRLVGVGRAMDICLRGRRVAAAEALEIGLVSEVVELADLQSAGLTLARELAASAPLAYAVVKQAMQRGLESTMEAEWQANLGSQALLLGTKDFAEGLDAARTRRQPTFKGE